MRVVVVDRTEQIAGFYALVLIAKSWARLVDARSWKSFAL
jgi:hypothetical protein